MTSPISTATQAPPATQASVNPPAVKAKDTPAQPGGKSAVSISSAGQSALKAALAEAIETPAQTAQEARGNDRQAQRLLASQAAAKI